jgi:oligopeptide transport system substrate-binding protein
LCAVAVQARGAGVTPAWKKKYLPADDNWRKTRQHLVFNNGTEPETLDPHGITGVPGMRLVYGLYEGLTRLDPKTLEPRPGVAESWSISNDGLVYTFALRADAAWSDGRKMSAGDFVRSWRRALAPATGNAYANLFFHIDGAEPFFRGQQESFDRVGVKAAGELTLEVRLATPCSYFLDLAAFPTFYPLRPDMIEKHGNRWTRPGNLVCNGPFRLSAWEPRQHVVLEPNPCYWDRATVKLDKVTALPLDDMNTAYQLFLKGKVHWLTGIPQSRIEEIKRHPDYIVSPYFGTYFYRFNVTRPPFDDSRVRRAFCLATDKREITEHILKSGQTPVGSLCPPVAGYRPVKGLEYDRRRAAALLAEAGYGPGARRFPAVEILYNTSEAHKLIAEAIAQQWKRNLGVTVNARNVEWKVFLNDMRNLDYQVCRSSWIGDYGDPSTFFSIFTSEDGNNRTGWSNATYDRLYDRAQKETDRGRRLALFERIETILVSRDCPILPVYRYVNQTMLSEKVRGWHQNIRDVHDLKYVWMEEE